MPARTSQYADLQVPISEQTRRALAVNGVKQLFSHQAHAIQATMNGRSVMICTSTASGKSVCYLIPILEALVEDRESTALLMFPTKALAQDQLRVLRKLCSIAFPCEPPQVEVPCFELYFKNCWRCFKVQQIQAMFFWNMIIMKIIICSP